jgi:transposase
MLSSGMSYTQITKELGIKSKSTVSDYFIKAVEKGYLTKEKKLTEQGRTLIKTLPEYNSNWQETDDE